MDKAHVGELLSGFLDGELTQQQAQRVRLHLEACEDCARTLEELRALRERLGRSGLGGKFDDVWREDMNDSGVRWTRGIGWLLLIGAALLIGAVVVYSFLTDPAVSAFMKFVISAFYLGLAALFVSVLRQRMIESKGDKYKDVEI